MFSFSSQINYLSIYLPIYLSSCGYPQAPVVAGGAFNATLLIRLNHAIPFAAVMLLYRICVGLSLSLKSVLVPFFPLDILNELLRFQMI